MVFNKISPMPIISIDAMRSTFNDDIFPLFESQMPNITI